jgi:2-polyprenyl-6-methoxyphenol hydroxylase-like FAD-dependent oxidoreductase
MIEPEPPSIVLIVGAGPGGLFAACELLRHGVKPRVVERRLAPHRETRGTVLQPAVLEMLERAGLIELFCAPACTGSFSCWVPAVATASRGIRCMSI